MSYDYEEITIPNGRVDRIDFWISPPVLYSVIRTVDRLSHYLSARSVQVLSVVERIRDRVEIEEIRTDVRSDLVTVAIDSTYTIPYLELIGGNLAIVAAGFVRYPALKKGINSYATATIVLDDEVQNFENYVSKIAQYMERKVLHKLLRKLERGYRFDLVAIDGSILPAPLPFALPSGIKGRSESKVGKVLSKSFLLMKEIIKLARKHNVAIVGIIKRVRTRFFSVILGEKAPVNDKVIASLILKPSTYLVLGKLGNIVREYVKYVRGLSLREVDEVRDVLPEVNDIDIVFYRSSRSLYMQSTKVEVLNFSNIDLRDIISYLCIHTTHTGVPHFMDMVDTYIRCESRVLPHVQQILESKVIEKGGLSILTGFTNPQKMYLYRDQVHSR